MADLNYILIGGAGHVLTGNCGDVVTGTYQNINATPAEVLVKLQLHAAEVIGIGT